MSNLREKLCRQDRIFLRLLVVWIVGTLIAAWALGEARGAELKVICGDRRVCDHRVEPRGPREAVILDRRGRRVGSVEYRPGRRAWFVKDRRGRLKATVRER